MAQWQTTTTRCEVSTGMTGDGGQRRRVITYCLLLSLARSLARVGAKTSVVEKCDVPQTMRRLCGPFDGDRVGGSVARRADRQGG